MLNYKHTIVTDNVVIGAEVQVVLCVGIGYDSVSNSTVSIGDEVIVEYAPPEKTVKDGYTLEYTSALESGTLTFHEGYYLIPATLHNLASIFPDQDILGRMFERCDTEYTHRLDTEGLSSWGKSLRRDVVANAYASNTTGMRLKSTEDIYYALNEAELKLTSDYLEVSFKTNVGAEITTGGNVSFVKLVSVTEL